MQFQATSVALNESAGEMCRRPLQHDCGRSGKEICLPDALLQLDHSAVQPGLPALQPATLPRAM